MSAANWFGPIVSKHRQHDILVAVDLKADGVGKEVVRLAEKLQVLHRLLFIGKTISDPKVRNEIRQASSKAHTAAVANNAGEFQAALSTSNADWVYLRYLPTAEEIATVHRSGKHAFIAGSTVAGNVPDNWARASEAGLDGIMTDYPLELRGLLRKRSRPAEQ